MTNIGGNIARFVALFVALILSLEAGRRPESCTSCLR